MKTRRVLLFFLLPYAVLFVIFVAVSWADRSSVRDETEELVREQLRASAGILRANIVRLSAEGRPAEEILSLAAGEERIYYVALLAEDKSVLAWSSRFEGYLPLSLRFLEGGRDSWTLDSPGGRIFNLFTPLNGAGEAAYLYLGYSLEGLERVLDASRRNFLLVTAVFGLAGLLLFRGAYLLQRRYLRKREEAEKARREKEHFKELSGLAAGVAHEIKNPLNAVALLCDLMRRKGPADMAGDIRAGRAEVEKIAAIVDQFSRAVRPLAPTPTKFTASEAFEEAGRGLVLRPGDAVSYREKKSVLVEADRTLLVQALGNLMRNALESSPAVRVTVSAERRGGEAVLTVEDDGPGIAPEDLGRIFEPFYSTKEAGMGIGLFLARKIVEAHRGAIEVLRRPEGGTAFAIRLPGGGA